MIMPSLIRIMIGKAFGTNLFVALPGQLYGILNLFLLFYLFVVSFRLQRGRSFTKDNLKLEGLEHLKCRTVISDDNRYFA